MANLGSKLAAEPLRSIDSATFTGNYQAVGTALANPSRIILFVNNSGVLVTISFDGVTDHFVMPAGASFILDENANAVSSAIYVLAAGTQIYVKGAASTGLFYISTFYVV